MALDNFENQLQRKLNERTIAPSANAWERVQYNRQTQKRKKRNLLWYYISAAVVLIGGFALYVNEKAEPVKPQVVFKEVVVPLKAIDIPQLNSNPKTEQIVVTEKTRKVPSENPAKVSSTPINESNEIATTTPDPETEKVSEVLAVLEQKAQLGEKITEDSVEALLSNAQRELAMEKSNSKKETQTNGTALLQEAETKSDRTFKEKVYSAFHGKFKTIKIAFKDSNP